MKLTELAPRWCADFDAPADAKQGISFLCPHCKVRRLAIWFDVPICGSQPVKASDFTNRCAMGNDPDYSHPERDSHIGINRNHPLGNWHRTGETFETLSLSPSVDASAFGCWHGFITNGEVN